MEGKALENWLMRRILREREAWRGAEDTSPISNSPAIEAHKGAELAYRDMLKTLTGETMSAYLMEERLSKASA